MESLPNYGGIVYIYNQKLFIKNKSRDQINHYYCRTKSCNLGLSETANGNITLHGEHTGHDDEADIAKIRTRAMAKKQLKTNQRDTPVEAFNDAHASAMTDLMTRGYNDKEAVLMLPDFKQLKSSLYRSKNKTYPFQPDHRKDLVLSENWKNIDVGPEKRSFLLADSEGANRIIIFATQDSLRDLCAADMILMDGTFYACPTIFTQIYTIHGVIGSKVFSLAYALLPRKSTTIYVEMFQMIDRAAIEIGLRFNPKEIRTDFEASMIAAVRNFFVSSQLRCCFFHYSQSILKHVGNCGFKTEYDIGVPEVKRFVKQIIALALMSLDEVEGLWIHAIRPNAPDVSNITGFVQYYGATWMGTTARFPPVLWNHFNRYEYRTTNHCEGFHNRLKTKIRGPHPNFFKFVDTLREIETENRNSVIRSHIRRPIPKPLTEFSKQYLSAVEAYMDSDDIINLLTAVSVDMRIPSSRE